MTSQQITPGWLRSVGFTNNLPCHVHGTPNENWWHEELQLEIWQLNDGPWLWIKADSHEMTRPEQLEALMHWLRITK